VRVFVYAQHLSGVGHYVRGHEIARALAEAHDVALLEGGFEVPRSASGPRVRRIRVPGVRHGAQGLEPTDEGRRLASVLEERRRALSAATTTLAPDAVVIEHYPFSKWELETEILAVLDAARAANPAVLRVCAIRDVCRKTRHEAVADGAYVERVLARLSAHFDAVLVHADPAVTRLEEHFDAAHRIPVPVAYTGYVSERAVRAAGNAAPSATAGYVVASEGAGSGGDEFVFACVDAWRSLHVRRAVGDRSLVVFPGLLFPDASRERLRRETSGGPFVVREFSSDFLDCLVGADLSVGRAGYNTCTNVLETRKRAVLVPDPRMSDQRFRARRLADLGLATCLEPEHLSVERLAAEIEAALAEDPPEHAVDLDGARGTRRVLQELSRPTGARTTGR
jgi:predicted glycosyltransferase